MKSSITTSLMLLFINVSFLSPPHYAVHFTLDCMSKHSSNLSNSKVLFTNISKINAHNKDSPGQGERPLVQFSKTADIGTQAISHSLTFDLGSRSLVSDIDLLYQAHALVLTYSDFRVRPPVFPSGFCQLLAA